MYATDEVLSRSYVHAVSCTFLGTILPGPFALGLLLFLLLLWTSGRANLKRTVTVTVACALTCKAEMLHRDRRVPPPDCRVAPPCSSQCSAVLCWCQCTG